MRFSNQLSHHSFRCLFAALALLPAAVSAATGIHLSPAGNDANPGTAALPVATPQGAQVRVRSLIQTGLADSVEVIFAGGTYVMDAPLELRPEDSGTAAFPINWKAATGAEVMLSGGKPITSTWTNDGGIWHTDLAGIGLGANQWYFRQLFVNGSRATRARYPNVTASNPFLYATGGGMDNVVINPALVKASWGTATDAQLNIVPQSRFFNQWNTVTGVNTSTGRIDIADSERHRLIDNGSWFWIEGVQAELDEPGEWFLNTSTGRLYYMPQPGVNPNTLTIIAPFLNRIVNAKGDVNAGTHVANVHFDGLKFLFTSFTLGQIEARVHTDTAIMFENTNNCSVKNCYFENIGGYALWLHLDSQRNVFDHNRVQYSGGGGVLLTGSRFAYMDDSKIYTPGEAAAKVAPILNEITNNTVEHCGKIRYYGGGVHLDSRPFSMTMAPGNHIAHNHFNDLSRNGVFAFRNQGGNVIEYNHIHNGMQTTIDGAAIHFATMNTVNAPNFILNNWLYDIWGWKQQSNGSPVRTLANGVFLDWDTSNTTVKDNWIYNTGAEAVKVIFGGNQKVVQSGNSSSSTVITPPFVAEVGPAGTATNGIKMETNKLTGSIISYQDTARFSQTGAWTPETTIGMVNLFEFKFLTGSAAVPSQAIYTLPITEDGNYQISLLYKPGVDRASNVPVAIKHADGIANVSWNMQQGSTYGFAVPVGTYRFVAAQTNTVTLATTGTNGKVIADSVAFVKVEENPPPTGRNTLIEEDFGGSGGALHGTSTDTFASAITAAGGSATWVAASNFRDNGVVNLATRQAAYLNLGSYINNAKGTAAGKFELTMTIGPTVGSWISLGFAAENTPNTLKDFTNSGSGTATTTGLATIIYRATGAVGELDMFGGNGNANAVDGPDGNTGNRTLTVTLDLSPAGGFNGTSNFGTVTWSDSVLGNLGTFTYTTTRTFGSLLITESASSSGTVSALKLTQISSAPPPLTFATWIGGFGLAPADQDFGDDPDGDGLANGIEAWFGTHPGQWNQGLAGLATNGPTATFTHPQNISPPTDLNGFYQWSPNLIDWYASGNGPASGPTVSIVPNTVGTTTTLTAIASGALAGLFLRVGVSRN